jgi:hypothetical protein
VHDQEQSRPEHEEADERQVHAKEWQSDRALEEEVTVRHTADGDEKVEQHEEVSEPKARADIGGVDHRVA